MLVVTGVFDNGQFIPDKPVSIPQKKRVIVTIEEEPETTSLQNKWREIGEAVGRPSLAEPRGASVPKRKQTSFMCSAPFFIFIFNFFYNF